MRLIDADALKAEFTGNFGRELWHYTGIWATIGVAPTIDAVPVVRCEKCRFGRNPLPDHGVRRCTKTLQFHPNDWYCPNGMRKDGDT